MTKITADTITDEQIRELQRSVSKTAGIGASDRVFSLCAIALARPEPTATGRGNGDIAAWRKARARCAEILNTRTKES